MSIFITHSDWWVHLSQVQDQSTCVLHQDCLEVPQVTEEYSMYNIIRVTFPEEIGLLGFKNRVFGNSQLMLPGFSISHGDIVAAHVPDWTWIGPALAQIDSVDSVFNRLNAYKVTSLIQSMLCDGRGPL